MSISSDPSLFGFRFVPEVFLEGKFVTANCAAYLEVFFHRQTGDQPSTSFCDQLRRPSVCIARQ